MKYISGHGREKRRAGCSEGARFRRRSNQQASALGHRGRWLNRSDGGDRFGVHGTIFVDLADSATGAYQRHFGGKVSAVNAAIESVKELQFEVLGNLDADISFEPDYLSFLMQKFEDDSTLGVAGTPFTEDDGYDTARDSFEGENYVSGGCQLFRYRCFQDVGGYVPNPGGGVDWIATMTARMRGWKVRAFLEKRYHHHRSLGTAERGKVAALFSYGQKDYYLGGSPVWQVFRCLYRSTKPPIMVGGVALLTGFTWAAIRRVKRPVSDELMQFHRKQQMQKLMSIGRTLLKFKKVDAFRSVAE